MNQRHDKDLPGLTAPCVVGHCHTVTVWDQLSFVLKFIVKIVVLHN